MNNHFTNKNSYQSDALFTLCIDPVFGGKYWYMVNDIIARYHLKLTLTKLSSLMAYNYINTMHPD